MRPAGCSWSLHIYVLQRTATTAGTTLFDAASCLLVTSPIATGIVTYFNCGRLMARVSAKF